MSITRVWRAARLREPLSRLWGQAGSTVLGEPVCRRWPAARSGGVLCSHRDARGDSTEAVGGRSHRLADHHIVHKVSTRQLVEFPLGSPYQACSPPCSLRSYPSDCECLLN